MKPPYTKHLQPAPEIRVYIGTDAWNAAKVRHAFGIHDALVTPEGECPAIYNWPVSGKSVLIIQAGNCDLEEVPDLASILLQSGATIVRVVYDDKMAVYRPARRVAA